MLEEIIGSPIIEKGELAGNHDFSIGFEFECNNLKFFPYAADKNTDYKNKEWVWVDAPDSLMCNPLLVPLTQCIETAPVIIKHHFISFQCKTTHKCLHITFDGDNLEIVTDPFYLPREEETLNVYMKKALDLLTLIELSITEKFVHATPYTEGSAEERYFIKTTFQNLFLSSDDGWKVEKYLYLGDETIPTEKLDKKYKIEGETTRSIWPIIVTSESKSVKEITFNTQVNFGISNATNARAFFLKYYKSFLQNEKEENIKNYMLTEDELLNLTTIISPHLFYFLYVLLCIEKNQDHADNGGNNLKNYMAIVPRQEIIIPSSEEISSASERFPKLGHIPLKGSNIEKAPLLNFVAKREKKWFIGADSQIKEYDNQLELRGLLEKECANWKNAFTTEVLTTLENTQYPKLKEIFEKNKEMIFKTIKRLVYGNIYHNPISPPLFPPFYKIAVSGIGTWERSEQCDGQVFELRNFDTDEQFAVSKKLNNIQAVQKNYNEYLKTLMEFSK